MTYAMQQGRVLTWALEAHVVDHCNLRCEHCCTESPHLSPRATRPETLRRDLLALAPVLSPHVFRVSGGEPLLHPDLVGCVQAVRDSGICRTVSLTTNGVLLPRAPTELWSKLDRITLSWYSSAPLSDRHLSRIEDLCRQHDVRLTIKPASSFQVMLTTAGRSVDEVQQVFDTCWLKVRCHLVHEGRFYCCTRPPHVGFPGDGVSLDAPDLRDRLLEHLQRNEPLAACDQCLGGRGPWQPHRQL